VVELKKELMYYNACNFPSIILYAAISLNK
jgi:hypothetical protein